MEVAILPKHCFVAAVAVSYSIIRGNPAIGGGWKKTKEKGKCVWECGSE